MKKTLSLLLSLACALCQVLPVEGRVVERTYLFTDRDVYVAGDELRYSAFCLDASRGELSNVSAVAYVELRNGASTVCTGKVALKGGRGAGSLKLPVTIPTGNYRLVAYTSQNKAERGYDFTGIASKVISVYNVFSTERAGEEMPDQVRHDAPDQVRHDGMAQAGGGVIPGLTRDLELSWDGGSLTLVNHARTAMTLSLSVYHDDGFPSNGNPVFADFLSGCAGLGPRFFNDDAPEYEGEVIRAHVAGSADVLSSGLAGRVAFLSSPSLSPEVYAATIDPEGRAEFYTGNIYGEKECVCEIEGDVPAGVHLELESPFAGMPVAAVPPLRMDPSLKDALLERSVRMQIGRQFASDTLQDRLPVRDNALKCEDEAVYRLDDYTRFPTMEEVLVEIVQELRYRRRSDGTADIKVRLNDVTGGLFSQGPTLMLLDGVPVFDQQKIIDYDPSLVESIHVYPHVFSIGQRYFEGVANFVTYKHNLPSFPFGDQVRVVEWQGASYPEAISGETVSEAYPDYRPLRVWQPLLEIEPGGSLEFPCTRPLYGGSFIAVAEGLAADGTSVRAEIRFEL